MNTEKKQPKTKSILIKICALAILIAIAACMMVIGRGHTVYFDSKELEYEGTVYEVPYKIEVMVNGERVAKLYEDERGMATWIGQDFEMELVVTQEKKGEEVTEHYEVKLPYNMDGIVLNLPALRAGLPEEAYLSEFVSLVADTADDEEVTVDEFGMDATLGDDADAAADAAEAGM